MSGRRVCGVAWPGPCDRDGHRCARPVKHPPACMCACGDACPMDFAPGELPGQQVMFELPEVTRAP